MTVYIMNNSKKENAYIKSNFQHNKVDNEGIFLHNLFYHAACVLILSLCSTCPKVYTERCSCIIKDSSLGLSNLWKDKFCFKLRAQCIIIQYLQDIIEEC